MLAVVVDFIRRATCVSLAEVEFTFKSVLKLGEVVPIPTLPDESILMRSEPPV
jgi:hypothetical protein